MDWSCSIFLGRCCRCFLLPSGSWRFGRSWAHLCYLKREAFNQQKKFTNLNLIFSRVLIKFFPFEQPWAYSSGLQETAPDYHMAQFHWMEEVEDHQDHATCRKSQKMVVYPWILVMNLHSSQHLTILKLQLQNQNMIHLNLTRLWIL